MINSCTVVIRVITLMVMTLFFTQPSIANETGASKSENRLFFSLGNDRGLPDEAPLNEFDCSDKVYAVMNLEQIEPGKRHHLAFFWYSPDEELRELTEFPIFTRNSNVKQWAWLKLHRAFGASMLQLLNPAAGMEEFIGDWRVEVKINNELIANKTFKVIC